MCLMMGWMRKNVNYQSLQWFKVFELRGQNMKDKYGSIDVSHVLITIEYDENLDESSREENISGGTIIIHHNNGLNDRIRFGDSGAKTLDKIVETDEYKHVGSSSPYQRLDEEQEHNPEYPSNWDQFKKQIIRRDRRECLNCGASDELRVDDIVPTKDRGNFLTANFATLCDSCYQNKNRESEIKTTDYPDNWDDIRREVYKSSNYRCQNCGIGGGNSSMGEAVLNAHHIVPRSCGGSDRMSNLITLCDSCHNSCHRHM